MTHYSPSPSLFLVTAALLSACGNVTAAKEFPKTSSSSIAQSQKTSLGESLKSGAAIHKGKSGFRLLSTGTESFAMRLALIQAAEKSIDLQYYSIHDDTTANLLLEAILRAARRGVRVRFLIDNINADEVDNTLSVMDGVKNVEIRLFNPFATRKDGWVTRMALAMSDLQNMERRMHNKVLIADNQMAILGGRNLGDEYFEENTDRIFKDIDILVAGPLTARISSHSFDSYWNSKDAVPIGQIYKPDDPAQAEKIRASLSAHWQKTLETEKGRKLLESPLPERLKDANVKLIWAKAELAVDDPSKIDKNAEDTVSRPLNTLGRIAEGATDEFIIVSPYFVPRKEGVEWLKELVARGVKVKLLTNSLASTDVVAVHTGYKRYREAVLESGVELYEMKPSDGRPKQRLLGKSAPAHASLHAKVYVADRREVMVGSFNLDPRSMELNTELAIVVHSPELASQVVQMFTEVSGPETSYRVTKAPDEQWLPWSGGLQWETMQKGKPVSYASDPEAGVGRRLQNSLMSLLPLEDHL